MSATLAITGTLARIAAVLLRHLYLWRGSWTRLFDLLYWPVLQVTMERWPKVGFHAVREHGEQMVQGQATR